MKRPRFESLIVFEDDDYIVINKPPYLSSLKDRADPINVLDLARNHCTSAQVAHRLDKETSGVLALAKHPGAYRHLTMQFEQRAVVKNYRAIVPGTISYKMYEVSAQIKVLPKGLVRLDPVYGKPATTIFDTLKIFKKHTLLNCQPVTGRTHQIRIHLASLGAPIVGDIAYGGRHFFLSEIKHRFNLKKHTEELPLIRRVALHAYSLEFNLLSGETQTFEAPLPKDFDVVIKQLEKNL
ncbi:MAG: RluA family pseudouridine synthase [Cyclobacteriaceae bacterium]